MSKPITLAKPAARAVSTAPTTPPAGPDRIASLPRNSPAEVSPPEDCMKKSRDDAPPERGSPVGACAGREGVVAKPLDPTPDRRLRSDPPLAGEGRIAFATRSTYRRSSGER